MPTPVLAHVACPSLFDMSLSILMIHKSDPLQPLPGTAPTLDLTGTITKLDGCHAECGGFSDVYRCRHTTPNGLKEVAVKAFRFHFSVTQKVDKADKMIRREVGIWRRLRHPNIVPFLGFVCDFGIRGNTSLVSEWMPNGTLNDFCTRYDDRLMLAHRLQLLLDIANGLSYLHLLRVVHGNLSCTNILIDCNFNACLTDFGLASMIGDIPDALRYLQITTLRPGAIRWSAPEHFSANANEMAKHTTKSDIYSFGNLSLFTLSGKYPWSEVRLDTAVILRFHQGHRPDRPTSRAIEDKHWEFIGRCWSPVDERPQAEDIVASVKIFLDSCLPAPPLQHLICIPPDSVEPLGASPSLGPRFENSKRVHYDHIDWYPLTVPYQLSWNGETTPSPYSPVQSTLEQKQRQSFDGHATPQEHTSPCFRCQWMTSGMPCNALIAFAGNRRNLVRHLRDHYGEILSGSAIITCQWVGCTASMQGRSIPRHILSVHFEFKVQCPVCGIYLSRPVSRKHQQVCPGAFAAEEDEGIY